MQSLVEYLSLFKKTANQKLSKTNRPQKSPHIRRNIFREDKIAHKEVNKSHSEKSLYLSNNLSSMNNSSKSNNDFLLLIIYILT